MTPRDKAEELICRFMVIHTILHCKNGCITIDSIGLESSKQASLVLIDQILSGEYVYLNEVQIEFWEEVITEIKNYEHEKMD
jgi:hypothetical protein